MEPPLDRRALDAVRDLEEGEDVGVAAEIARSFLARAGARIEELRALARRPGGADALARAAHALAGSAALVGGREVRAACRAVELHARTDPAAAAEALDALPAAGERLCDALAAWLEEDAAGRRR